MIALPKLNIRRTLLIARRDYFGYIKTWGFWISFFLPFIFMILGFFAATLDLDFSPTKYETIVDQTGQHAPGIMAKLDEDNIKLERAAIEASARFIPGAEKDEIVAAFDAGGIEAAGAYLESKAPGASGQIEQALERVNPPFVFVDPPATNIEELTPYLTGAKTIMVDGEVFKLSGALFITDDPETGTSLQYWSTNSANAAPKTKRLAERYFRDRAEAAYLQSGNLSKDGLSEARKGGAKVEVFNPEKSASEDGTGQAVTATDRIPYFVAAGLAGILWLTVFSGAYMLLTSMLEEKLNKLLEMMLASTRFSEIIFGKLIGVAALTITAMAPYIITGIVGIIGLTMFAPPEVAAGLTQAFTPKIMIFFVLFLILGYIFYGAFFIALGAMSQSMQDAQTLTTPIVLVLTLCVLVVPMGLENPDSPLLRIASFVPFSAPFACIVRLPSDPPLWELLLSAGVLALLCIGVIALAGRIFRFGVLSGSGAGAVTAWFKRVILRKKVA